MIVTLLVQGTQRPPGATKVPGDTLLHGLDTLAGAAMGLRDTLSQAPLPGGVATLFRFVFQMPQWVQIGGAVVGAVAAVALLVVLWRRRLPIWTWLRTRTRGLKLALGAAALTTVAVLLFGGMSSWNYMQHDNAFCTGCHIMERPFRRFSAGAGRHEDLKCHDCHQQSIFASTRQMVLWVAERPEKIGVHAPVPNMRCESCHQRTDSSRKPWQHALYLAGHKVHFGSDSSALKDLSCAKCHGAEVHRFIPSAGACQQSGCHENQKIRMAAMARLPEIKCTTCHAFTADIPALADRDSAVRAMIPSARQCLSCHGMTGKPSGYIPEKDPHKGSCGSCHDIHRDSMPQEARARCTTCHKDLAKNAFHNGVNHRRLQAQCMTCHEPHAASVDPSDCVTCHTKVQKRGLFKAPLPFDTNAVLRRRIVPPPGTSTLHSDDEPLNEHRGKGDAFLADPPPRAPPATASRSFADSFPHRRHTSLPCLTCHAVNSQRKLVFEAPRGCDLCHHQSLIGGAVVATDCARCHPAAARGVARPTVIKVTMPNKPAALRTVGFQHERHASTPCSACHQAPNTMPPDSIRTCQACHDQHHTTERNCATCHSRPETPAAHDRAAHVRCDACHTPSRIAPLVPTRSFCLTCHQPQRDHKPAGECSTCHFLSPPAEFRARLSGAGTG